MSIPVIAFKSIEEAEDHVLALLEDELGQENLNPLEVYCKLMTANNVLVTVSSQLACLLVAEQLEKHGFSDDSIKFLLMSIDEGIVSRIERSIVMDNPSFDFVSRQINLANGVIRYLNISN